MSYPDKLNNLIEALELLPTIGKKSAERLALHMFTEFSEDVINNFAKSIKEITDLQLCPRCHGISDEGLCSICSDEYRTNDVILVVENIKDVFVFEKTNSYSGQYHVLNGAINFANNIGVDDLNIDSLIKRINEFNVKEIILATNATTTGETTAKYINKLLENSDCNVTRLAHGLPVGGDISYTDEVTLKRAIDGRTNL
ncbi:MAG: recombination mediator RecR [bacterium]